MNKYINKTYIFEHDKFISPKEGIGVLNVKLPAKGKLLNGMSNPVGLYLTFQIPIDDTGHFQEKDYELFSIKDDVAFSVTPAFDSWLMDRIASLRAEGDEYAHTLPLAPKDELEFLHYDVIYKKSWYIKTYEFSVFDLNK